MAKNYYPDAVKKYKAKAYKQINIYFSYKSLRANQTY